VISLDRFRSGDVHVVVSLSGGKDSAATALHLRELGIPFSCVFADTGWESAETYRFLDDVLTPAFGPIARVRLDVDVPPDRMPLVDEVEAVLGISPSPMVRACIRKAMFPSRARKWCTTYLKIGPLAAHHRALADDGRTVVSVVGIRRDESAKRSDAAEWSIGPSLDAMVWQPIVTWSRADVFAIHRRHGLPINPLYTRQGIARVGCWPCINACKAEFAEVGKDDRRVAALRELERVVGDLRPSSAHRPAWHFGDGRPGAALPLLPGIDVVLGWANGPEDGQGDLWGGDAGCVSGLCEVAP
jgi:3'-phosphoadenosine 5'-phosphosulfate sulfotransferase (PAPS reductase)/FAD synthetase